MTALGRRATLAMLLAPWCAHAQPGSARPRLITLGGALTEIAYALNVPSVAVEVDGDTVYVRVPRERAARIGFVLPGATKSALALPAVDVH